MFVQRNKYRNHLVKVCTFQKLSLKATGSNSLIVAFNLSKGIQSAHLVEKHIETVLHVKCFTPVSKQNAK